VLAESRGVIITERLCVRRVPETLDEIPGERRFTTATKIVSGQRGGRLQGCLPEACESPLLINDLSLLRDRTWRSWEMT
jgi:hypothetical protein